MMANSNREEIIRHLRESNLVGDGQLEQGDLITSAVLVLKVERVDDPELQFAVVHTGDYITATGLLTLAKGVIVTSFEGDEEGGY